MALAYLTINLDAFTGDDHPPISQYSTITLDPGADHIDAAADVIHVRTIVVSLDQQGKAATANGVPCVDGKVPIVAGVMYAVSAPNVLRDGPHYIPALTAGQVVDLSDYITPGAPLTPDQAAILTARIKALEAAPGSGGGGGSVDSVNGETGVVVLDAADVGADPAGTAAGLVGALAIPDSADDVGAIPEPAVEGASGDVLVTDGAGGRTWATPDAGGVTSVDGKTGAVSLSDTYAAKGGATKTDGQNPRNLRRPTLLVDSMFPNGRHDHEIVWVDESIGRAYSIGQDKTLRLATWNPALGSQDIGAFPTGQRSKASATQTWAFHGLFFRTASGALLMEQQDAGVTTIQRSTPASDGLVWATVWTAAGDVIPLGPTAIAQDAVTGYLYFAEYSSGDVLNHVDLLRSTDDGVTWTVWKSMPKSAGGDGTIRHWHGARYDTVSQRVYFAAGDQNDIAGIYRVNAAGDDIEPVILNSQMDEFGLVAAARCVDMMFFPNHIAWGTDGSGGQNYVFRMARDQIGVAVPVVERVAAIDNTAWFCQQARTDGSMWLVCASSEIGGGGTGPAPDPSVAHLYAVSNDGAVVDEVAAISMEGLYGAGSLSGLAGPSGGDTFWLRAHAYQQFPFKKSSAFQFRARLAFGAVPFIKPTNVRHPVYKPESRNWAGTLAAGQTLTFGHSKSGLGTNVLYILNMGVRVNTGTASSVKLQVWNLTAGSLIHELGAVYADWRTDSLGDTSDYTHKYTVPPNNVVEFRLIETAGGTPTATAFIEFGYGA